VTPPREVGAPTPVTKSRRGDRGAGAHGRRGSTRHRAVRGRSGTSHESIGACRGGVWECCGGDDRRYCSVRRTLEEVEARLLYLEVSSRPSRRSSLGGRNQIFSFSCLQGGADRPPSRARQGALVRCIRPHEVAFI
jgi:hypothetical protein